MEEHATRAVAGGRRQWRAQPNRAAALWAAGPLQVVIVVLDSFDRTLYWEVKGESWVPRATPRQRSRSEAGFQDGSKTASRRPQDTQDGP